MKRLLILAPAVLLAFAALAQDAPQAGYQNLWCHLAFDATTKLIPPLAAEQIAAAREAGDAATPEQLELIAADDQIQAILRGIPLLLDAASASYTEAGFTPEQFETAKADLAPKVGEQISGAGGEAEFAFEDCVALLPAPAETTTTP